MFGFQTKKAEGLPLFKFPFSTQKKKSKFGQRETKKIWIQKYKPFIIDLRSKEGYFSITFFLSFDFEYFITTLLRTITGSMLNFINTEKPYSGTIPFPP